MTAGRVVVDLVAPQSPSYRERGIARHGLDFANALVDRHPQLVDRVLLHPDLPPVGGLEHVIASGKAATDLGGVGPGGVFHVTSAFEPEVTVRALWPRVVSAQKMRLVVTVYDLIPDVFPDLYLVDPGLRRRWRACRELARVADRVLALSESGADDVVRLLGVPAERVSVIGAGCDARFRPADVRSDALAEARAAVPGLGEHFVVYNGAIDPRKNLDRLVQAYAQLSPVIRDRWQLVLVCRADPLQRNHYLVMADNLGLAGRVLLPGYVSDDTLVSLYQSADLSVFPSLYEGYGLPVVEAQACGAPVIGGDNSSLRELLGEEARFDATDVADMASSMTRALTDDALHSRLLAEAHRPPPTWAEVADRTAAVYQDLLDHDRGRHLTPGWRRDRRVAVLSPFPGAGGTGPRAAFGEALASALEAAGAEVDRFVDGLAVEGPVLEGPVLDRPVTTQDADGAAAPPLRPAALRRMDHWRAGYDLVVCCIGNDPVHLETLQALRHPDAGELPIIVIAHEVPLAQLYDAAADADRLGAPLAAVLHDIYPGLPPEVGSDGRVDPATVRRHGLVLAREVIAVSRRYLVSRSDMANVARIDARPHHASRVEIVPEIAAAASLSTEGGELVGTRAALAASLLSGVTAREWAGTTVSGPGAR